MHACDVTNANAHAPCNRARKTCTDMPSTCKSASILSSYAALSPQPGTVVSVTIVLVNSVLEASMAPQELRSHAYHNMQQANWTPLDWRDTHTGVVSKCMKSHAEIDRRIQLRGQRLQSQGGAAKEWRTGIKGTTPLAGAWSHFCMTALNEHKAQALTESDATTTLGVDVVHGDVKVGSLIAGEGERTEQGDHSQSSKGSYGCLICGLSDLSLPS